MVEKKEEGRGGGGRNICLHFPEPLTPSSSSSVSSQRERRKIEKKKTTKGADQEGMGELHVIKGRTLQGSGRFVII